MFPQKCWLSHAGLVVPCFTDKCKLFYNQLQGANPVYFPSMVFYLFCLNFSGKSPVTLSFKTICRPFTFVHSRLTFVRKSVKMVRRTVTYITKVSYNDSQAICNASENSYMSLQSICIRSETAYIHT